jgi:NCS2 family nucleobase:cation symporter-2/xanthine permease XanP
MEFAGSSDRLLNAAEDRIGWPLALALGLTHVAMILDGIVFLPNMIGKAGQVPPDQVGFVAFATLLVSSLCTLVQTLRVGQVGCGFVLFMGSYSAFLSCVLAAVRLGGLELMATMTVLCAPVVLFYSYFLRFLRHIVTPHIGGVMVILVALSLMPIGLELWQGGNPGGEGFGSLENYLVGLATVVPLTLIMLFGNSRLRLWTPLLAIGSGCVAAGLFGLYSAEHLLAAPWIGLPHGSWPGLTLDVRLAHLPLLAAFVMAALVSAMEGTGNIMLLQQLSVRDFRKVDYARVQGGLYCDGLGKLAAGLCGAAPLATFCDNLPLLEMSRSASRRIGFAGAGILAVLAFVPKFSGFILDLPPPVIGGMLVAICAVLFYSGFGLVMREGLSFQMGVVLGTSLCAGLIAESRNFFPSIVPVELSPLLQNGVAMGGFTAIFLSTALHAFPKTSLTLKVRPERSRAPEFLAGIAAARSRFGLSESSYNRFQLACEETFLHLVEVLGNTADTCLLHVVGREEGLFVEVVCSQEVEDVDQIVRPFTLARSGEEELSKLGLLLLSRVARDVRHIHISGYAYISFLLDR